MSARKRSRSPIDKKSRDRLRSRSRSPRKSVDDEPTSATAAAAAAGGGGGGSVGKNATASDHRYVNPAASTFGQYPLAADIAPMGKRELACFIVQWVAAKDRVNLVEKQKWIGKQIVAYHRSGLRHRSSLCEYELVHRLTLPKLQTWANSVYFALHDSERKLSMAKYDIAIEHENELKLKKEIDSKLLPLIQKYADVGGLPVRARLYASFYSRQDSNYDHNESTVYATPVTINITGADITKLKGHFASPTEYTAKCEARDVPKYVDAEPVRFDLSTQFNFQEMVKSSVRCPTQAEKWATRYSWIAEIKGSRTLVEFEYDDIRQDHFKSVAAAGGAAAALS